MKTFSEIYNEWHHLSKVDLARKVYEECQPKDNARILTKDENGNCLHFHHEFGHKKCLDCGASLDLGK